MISIFSARDGNFGKLQDCHEAYQVLLKIIKVLSENLFSTRLLPWPKCQMLGKVKMIIHNTRKGS